MENASKALLMTASILVGLIILSLGIYLVNTFRTFSQDYNDSMEIQRMQQFNSEFTALATRSNISMHEILTLVNYANDFNYANNIDTSDSQFIHVYVTLPRAYSTNLITLDFSDLENELQKKQPSIKKDKVIPALLEGSYFLIQQGEDGEKIYGQYQYKNNEDGKTRTYYNCFRCDEYYVNPNTGRIEWIKFIYQENITLPIK